MLRPGLSTTEYQNSGYLERVSIGKSSEQFSEIIPGVKRLLSECILRNNRLVKEW